MNHICKEVVTMMYIIYDNNNFKMYHFEHAVLSLIYTYIYIFVNRHVIVWIFKSFPNFCIDTYYPSVNIWGGGAYGQWLAIEYGVCMESMCPYACIDLESILSFCHVSSQLEATAHESKPHSISSSLILDSQPPELWETIFCCLEVTCQ